MTPTTPSGPRPELLEQWSTAEQRLAMIAVADPDGYILHLELLSRVADRLGRCRDTSELEEAYADWESVVRPLLPEDKGGLDVASLAGAAWMVRYRQLAGARRQREAEERIAEARRHGQAWVTVWETDPSPPSAVFRPYERTTMRLADGVAVRALIDIDADTYEPVYSAEVLHLDPRDGSLPGAPSPEHQEVYRDRESWERGVRALQAEL